MRRLFLHSPKAYAVALALGAVLAALVLRFRGAGLTIWWADALSSAGAALILMGLLGLMARLGAFDTVGYGISRLRKLRYRDLYEYCETRKEKRRQAPPVFMAFIAVGALFLIPGLILRSLV